MDTGLPLEGLDRKGACDLRLDSVAIDAFDFVGFNPLQEDSRPG